MDNATHDDEATYEAPTPAPSRLRAPGMVGYCPWAHLGALEGVSLTWHEVGHDGETDFDAKTISLKVGMTDRERRSVLAHELAHIERGPGHGLEDSKRSKLEEEVVDLTAAMRLIPAFVLEELPELVQRHGRAAARDFLGIDGRVLNDALAGLEWLAALEAKR